MKKIILLIIASLSINFAMSQITSTTTGGNWSETSTWIGGVVPTSTDNVIIDGTVEVDGANECKDLTVNTGNTLTKDNNGRELQVNGSLTNNGTITENNYGAFSINISGDLTNNGTWEYTSIIFAGTSDNRIEMGVSNPIENSYISKIDSVSHLIIGSNSKFVYCGFSNKHMYPSLDTPYQIKIETGSGITLDLMKDSHFQ